MKQHPTFTNYLITTDGKVINKKRNRELSPGTSKEGYQKVGLMKDKKRHDKLINRLVLETYCPIENDHLYHAHHENQITNDNRLENLKWELIPDHIREHRKGKVMVEETKRKIRDGNKGQVRSEETRRNISEALKKKGFRPPSQKGIMWWNNGVRNIKSKEHPGEGWVRGRCLLRP